MASEQAMLRNASRLALGCAYLAFACSDDGSVSPPAGVGGTESLATATSGAETTDATTSLAGGTVTSSGLPGGATGTTDPSTSNAGTTSAGGAASMTSAGGAASMTSGGLGNASTTAVTSSGGQGGSTTVSSATDGTPTSSAGGGDAAASTQGAGGSSTATNGEAASGTTMSSMGGSGGDGGSPSTTGTSTDGSTPSTGCGATSAPASGRHGIDVGGTTREYILSVPNDYDSNQTYRLIFGWHWLGGSADDVAGGGFGGGGYYGLESRAGGTAIFVAPEGIDNGWANSGGRDIQFLEAMLDRFRSELCIDESRIFSTGFSYGGMMSLAVGCAMGDVFRAIAPMAGAFYSGCENGADPVAFWGSHGDADTVVPLGDGEEGRDEFLDRNNCGTATTPVSPSPCVTYQGCDAGYPVTWCEFSGGHSIPSFASDALWDFFSQF